MTNGNGNGNGNKTPVWIAILVSAVGASATLSYAVTKASLDNTDVRLDKIELALGKVDDKIELRINTFSKELSFRVEKAAEEHKVYDIRLDRLENKVGLR